MSEALLSAFKTRRSIRRYTPQPIEAAVLQRILEAAVWAPSAHNRQPWRFAVVRSSEVKATLARHMGEQLRRDRLADGDSEAVIDADVNRSYARINGAAVAILVCLSMRDMDTYPDQRRQSAEHLMAIQGTAMAAQNLMLAAHAEGLGACWLCAPLFAPDTVRASLDLPTDWEPQGLLTLGYPDGTIKSKTRNALEAVVAWR
jgi:coenzyme F420-0:L-glutamate ligase / coenzyme F420-1:gamma-L-glutamate ligase